MRRFLVWAGVGFIATGLAASVAVAADDESGDEGAIRELVANYVSAREIQDPRAIQELFTPDADQLVSSGEWRHGRAALVEGMLGSSHRNPGSRTITLETVRFPAEGVALADGRYVIRGRDGAPDRKMWTTFVAVKGDDGWRIAAIRNMLPAPPR